VHSPSTHPSLLDPPRRGGRTCHFDLPSPRPLAPPAPRSLCSTPSPGERCWRAGAREVFPENRSAVLGTRHAAKAASDAALSTIYDEYHHMRPHNPYVRSILRPACLAPEPSRQICASKPPASPRSGTTTAASTPAATTTPPAAPSGSAPGRGALGTAQADGCYSSLLVSVARAEVLVLDGWRLQVGQGVSGCRRANIVLWCAMLPPLAAGRPGRRRTGARGD
jgi:hypothetical protein